MSIFSKLLEAINLGHKAKAPPAKSANTSPFTIEKAILDEIPVFTKQVDSPALMDGVNADIKINVEQGMERQLIDQSFPALASVFEKIPPYRKKLLFVSNGMPRGHGYGLQLKFVTSPSGEINAEVAEPDDPSTIYAVLSVNKPRADDVVPKLGYFPSYSAMTEEQRAIYGQWLCDISNAIEIGYVFVYFYGLERHLVLGDFDSAVDEILTLRKYHKHSSFLAYSSSALVHASILRKRMDTLQSLYMLDDFDYFGNANLNALHHSGQDIPPDMMIRLARHMTGVKRRYLSEYPELYNEVLLERLKKLYEKEAYLFASEYILEDIDLTSFDVHFANISLPPEIRTPTLPNFMRHIPFKKEITSFFRGVDKAVKLRLDETANSDLITRVSAAPAAKSANTRPIAIEFDSSVVTDGEGSVTPPQISEEANVAQGFFRWSLMVECPHCGKMNDLASDPHDSDKKIEAAVFSKNWDALNGLETICCGCDSDFTLTSTEGLPCAAPAVRSDGEVGGDIAQGIFRWSFMVECPHCGKTNDLARGSHDSDKKIAAAVFSKNWDALNGLGIICCGCDSDFTLTSIKGFPCAAPAVVTDRVKADNKKNVEQGMERQLRTRKFGIHFELTPEMRAIIQPEIAKNVSLIKHIPSQYFTEVEGLVMRAVAVGGDLKTLTEELHERYGITLDRAGRIATDQNRKVNAVMSRVRQLECGFTHAEWRWNMGGCAVIRKHPTAAEVRMSEAHKAFSGKIYEIAKGAFIDGEYIWPGQKTGCQCMTLPVSPDYLK
jgi:hypothetical protein